MASAAPTPARSLARKCARAAGYSLGAGAAGASLAGAYLYATQPGVERSVRFWWHAGPIVVRYGWARFRARDAADRQERYASLHEVNAPRARAVIEELRGMFVKVGQVMSVRPEMVPDAYRREFRSLQDSAPPARWKPIEEALERDLGAPVDAVFSSVERQPLGAASIGQAHLVEWQGRQAVVKVQYPDASAMMRADFWCLETLLWVTGEADALRVTSQLRQQFEVELDYAQEAVHLRELHEAIGSAPEFRGRVIVPKPIPELTNASVIGMEYLPGPKLEFVCRQRLEALGVDFQGKSFDEWVAGQQRNRLEKLAPMPDGSPASGSELADRSGQPEKLADSTSLAARAVRGLGTVALKLLGMDVLMWIARVAADWKVSLSRRPESAVNIAAAELRDILQLVLSVHGFQLFFCPFFNGDPHPGNILLLPDGRVGLIDFGQCKQMQEADREALARLLLALAEPADAPGADARVAAAFAASGVRTRSSNERFMALLPRLMFCGLQPEMLDREKLREVFKEDKVEFMPTHVIMAYRAAMLLRGLCLVLQENVSVAEAWSPWARRWLSERGSGAAAAVVA